MAKRIAGGTSSTFTSISIGISIAIVGGITIVVIIVITITITIIIIIINNNNNTNTTLFNIHVTMYYSYTVDTPRCSVTIHHFKVQSLFVSLQVASVPNYGTQPGTSDLAGRICTWSPKAGHQHQNSTGNLHPRKQDQNARPLSWDPPIWYRCGLVSKPLTYGISIQKKHQEWDSQRISQQNMGISKHPTQKTGITQANYHSCR